MSKVKKEALSQNHQEKNKLLVSRESVTNLWHKRLRHYHDLGIRKMKSQGVVEGLDSKACQLGKQIRKPFPKIAWRATKKLKLIHTDVAGPQRTPSLKAKVKNESGCKIQTLRSDNCNEYTYEAFNKFCEKARIHT